MEMVYRLGWTLLHSLWEGAIVAAVTAVILRCLSRRTANARYLVACLATGILLAACAATFALSNRVTPPVDARVEHRSSGSLPKPSLPKTAGAFSVLPASLHKIHRAAVSAWVDDCSPLLGQTWLAGVLLLGIWRLGAWISVQRLRVLQIEPPETRIVEAARRLARLLNLSVAFDIRLSRYVQTPMVVGWQRTVILLPVSVVTGLSPEQLDGILAHELAHIRRHDYLVSLLQILAETLLFYHPAVWWLSRQIRLEREQACDDIALELVQNRHAYASSLAALEELRFAGSPVLAAKGSGGGQMLARVRRILGVNENGSRWSLRGAWSFLLIALLGGAICCQSTGSPKLSTKSTSVVTTGADGIFKFDVPFKLGKSEFIDGDEIAISSIKGTSADMQGGMYCIRGSYTLASHDQAHIGAFVTPADSNEGVGPINPAQFAAVQKGSGTFTLLLPVSIRGWPHVSFYSESDDSAGGPAAKRTRLELDQAITAYAGCQNRLVYSEQELGRLREKYGTLNLEDRSNKMQADLVDYERQTEAAKNIYEEAKAHLQPGGAAPVKPADREEVYYQIANVPDLHMQRLLQKWADAKDRLEEMSSRVGKNNPAYQAQEQMVALNLKNVDGYAHDYLASHPNLPTTLPDTITPEVVAHLKQRYDDLKADLEELRGQAKDLGIQMDQIAKTRNEISATKQQLQLANTNIARLEAEASTDRANQIGSSFGEVYFGTGDWVLQH